MIQKRIFTVLTVCGLIGVALIAVSFFGIRKGNNPQDESVKQEQSVLVPLPYEDVQKLTQKTALKEDVYMESADMPVPTNQWFSSVAFEKTSEPIFAYPVAVKMNADGFGVSYPKVVSTPDTTFASYDPDFKIAFDAQDLVSSIASYDDLSVSIAQKDADKTNLRLRVTHGSPYVFASLASKQDFKLASDDFTLIKQDDDGILFTLRGKAFAFFFASDELSVVAENNKGLNVSVMTNDARFSVAVLPSIDSFDVFKSYAFDPIVGTKVTSQVQDDVVKSNFSFVTQDNKETLIALLPHNMNAFVMQTSSIGTYQTLHGEQSLFKGASFDFNRDVPVLQKQLDISSLSEISKEGLRGLVRNDVKNITIPEEDTYFLGKKLFAIANLLDMAEQLEMEVESATLKTQLKTELELWRTNTMAGEHTKKYFYYDPTIRGVVGETASFGSELFNDHHFHYGYFIYAASILSRYDEQYLEENQSFINLLVQDIANTDREDTRFPYIRAFDAYAGHSFAAGQGLFADGNNQESSSEAVNAWYALYLWSEVIDNNHLKATALYLYSEESSRALESWLNIDRSESRFANFKHNFVSMVWGGKLDSSTWFSARPEAKLGIQIIPISPASLYLGRDTKRVEENMLSEKELQSPTMFKDYLAMYKSLYDSAGALRDAHALQKEDIDGANTRSFMEAWLLIRKEASKQ